MTENCFNRCFQLFSAFHQEDNLDRHILSSHKGFNPIPTTTTTSPSPETTTTNPTNNNVVKVEDKKVFTVEVDDEDLPLKPSPLKIIETESPPLKKSFHSFSNSPFFSKPVAVDGYKFHFTFPNVE